MPFNTSIPYAFVRGNRPSFGATLQNESSDEKPARSEPEDKPHVRSDVDVTPHVRRETEIAQTSPVMTDQEFLHVPTSLRMHHVRDEPFYGRHYYNTPQYHADVAQNTNMLWVMHAVQMLLLLVVICMLIYLTAKN